MVRLECSAQVHGKYKWLSRVAHRIEAVHTTHHAGILALCRPTLTQRVSNDHSAVVDVDMIGVGIDVDLILGIIMHQRW